MEGKRYYWLKLHDDFFSSKRIKKLRKMAGGDTYTIIYLKMQLIAMKNDGVLKWTGLESNFAAELALDLDEEEDNVSITLSYLLSCGLAETDDDVNYFLPYSISNTGSETASTQRSRECRARQKMLQCNTDATALQQTCNGEIEKEIEKDKEIEKSKSNRPHKKKYGEYKHVLLTDDEFQKLHNDFPNADDAITYLDEYIEMKGTKYKSHYLALRKWVFDALDEKKTKETKQKETGSFDTDDFFEAAVERSYGR